MTDQKRILLAEPYFGGSHRDFLAGLQAHVDMDFTLLTLPARKWKMRMQTAAPWLANQITDLYQRGQRFDGLLCSTFLDLAVLRTLLARTGINLPAGVYFHENQFAYPGRIRDPGYFQFTNINWTTALCADLLAFNSRFNFDAFLAGIAKFVSRVPDISLAGCIQDIKAKSTVLYPGIDFSAIDQSQPSATGRPCRKNRPVVVWNHRWEHDKDPDSFFSAMNDLAKIGPDFGLIVLGQQFRDQPQVFARAREQLGRHIIHFGYAPNRDQYAALLGQADLVVSTARHEFFGISVLEAVRAGCRPLVPDRLSYVELYPDRFRYQDNALVQSLVRALAELPAPDQRARYHHMAARYGWPFVAQQYRDWLDRLCGQPAATFLDNS